LLIALAVLFRNQFFQSLLHHCLREVEASEITVLADASIELRKGYAVVAS
jgi:hypothetical protein